jgi:hypothetical protein
MRDGQMVAQRYHRVNLHAGGFGLARGWSPALRELLEELRRRVRNAHIGEALEQDTQVIGELALGIRLAHRRDGPDGELTQKVRERLREPVVEG